MKNTQLILLALAFFFQPLFGEETPATTPTPAPAAKEAAPAPEFTGDQLAIQKRMDGLFEASKKVNLASAEKAKAREQIEKAMDWDRVVQACLGASLYKKHAGASTNEFKKLLKEVIVKTAFSRLDKFWADGTTYKLSKIDITGTTAHVVSNFYVKGDVFALDYYLLKKGGDWYVWDISYENERYSVNINEQLDAFLKERKFSELLVKLKKRIEELDSQAKTSKG